MQSKKPFKKQKKKTSEKKKNVNSEIIFHWTLAAPMPLQLD